MNAIAETALLRYIAETSEVPEALSLARQDAEEFGLAAPDQVTGQLLTTLTLTAAAGLSHSDGNRAPGAIAVTPAAGVVGAYLLRGLGPTGTLTCIDPEAEHQNSAKVTFRELGYSTSRVRFLPSRPLDVMGRLANNAYQLIYADVAAADLSAIIDAAWPLLSRGGTLVLADALLDGTLADATRKDRDIVAAREADEKVRELDDAIVTRLPLGAGLILVTKK